MTACNFIKFYCLLFMMFPIMTSARLNTEVTAKIGIIFFADSDTEVFKASKWITDSGWITYLIVSRKDNPELWKSNYDPFDNMFVDIDAYSNGKFCIGMIGFDHKTVTVKKLATVFCSARFLAEYIFPIPSLYTDKNCYEIINIDPPVFPAPGTGRRYYALQK